MSHPGKRAADRAMDRHVDALNTEALDKARRDFDKAQAAVRAVAVERYQDYGASVIEIARGLGVTRQTVYRWLREAGVEF